MGTRAGGLLISLVAVFLVLSGARAIAAAEFEATPVQINFGDRVVDLDYGFREVELTGTADPVNIQSLEVTGTDAALFAVLDWNCEGAEIDQSSSCFFDVNFSPDATGDRSASVIVQASSGDPVTIPLSGNGVTPAVNGPDLGPPTINTGFNDGNNLWGFAGGDFAGQGRSGVVAVSQMDDSSVKAAFANGSPEGLLSTPVLKDLTASGFAGTAATGDFNGDGDLDAIASAGGGAFLILNQGAGVMGEPSAIPDGGNGLDDQIAAGDFNGDGKQDLVGGYVPGDDSSPYVFLMVPGRGDGTFDGPVDTPVNVDGTQMGIAAGDFNNDDVSDLAVSSWDGDVIMFEGNEDGVFTETGRFGPACGCASPWGLTIADLNNDNLGDVAATMRYEDEVHIFQAQADGGFVRGQRLEIPFYDGWNPNPYSIAARDMNGDAIPDLLTGNYLNDTATAFVGRGDGSFDFAETLVVPTDDMFLPHGTYIGDFNGDGRLDPSLAGQVGDVAIFLNQGEPGQVLSPTALDFGDQTDGTESAPQTVTLSNQDGLAELRVSLVEVAGGFSNDFEIKGGDCLDGPIPVGGSCQVEVAFTPVGPAGARDSDLYFSTNNTVESLISVPLDGMSIDPVPTISVDPVSLDFGSVEVGSESTVKSIAVSSTGTGSLHIDSVTLGGPGAASFTQVSGNCVGSFAPGAGCQISYRFRPSAVGATNATVELATNTAVLPVDISLAGTGQAKPVVQPPRVIVRKRPKGLIRIRTRRLKQVRVAFRANQAGARFQCRIDRRKFSGCKSPKFFRKIKPGKHVIRIRAIKNGKTGPAKVIRFRIVRKR